jgi:hypothetical protein
MRLLRIAMRATAVALVALCGYVAVLAYPSTEAVRLRNSFLMLPADPAVGDWTPHSIPASFVRETAPMPDEIASAARLTVTNVSSDLERGRRLASYLMVHASETETGPIRHRLSVETTYREIINNGRGYCSDYIDAFTALSLGAELPVRAWAFSFDGFGGHGHIVAEIFDAGSGRWVMLDVFNNVMPVAAGTGEPLSVRDFLPRFRQREQDVLFVPIGPGRLGYPVDAKLRDYYRRGIDQWYLWNGNNVVSRSQHPRIVALLGSVADPLGEVAAVFMGEFPRIVALPTRTNAELLLRMDRLHVQLLAIAAMCIAFGIALIALLWMLRKYAPSRISYESRS